MADYLVIAGRTIPLPRECEHNMAARAAFIAQAEAEMAATAPLPKTPKMPPRAKEKL